MRPLRLLLAVSTSVTAVTLLLFLALGSPRQHKTGQADEAQSNIKALFSFASPGSLFPPSAIISLTDDNSTFFLARPAAFGPVLPKDSLSGSLWIGSGSADDSLGWGGELGCGDVPGWDYGHGSLQASTGTDSIGKRKTAADDGTDDYTPATTQAMPVSSHADIQLLQESAEIAGKVVLLMRGGCGFLAKVQWAQRRGGVAVIVGDDVRGGALVRMYAKGDTSNITIPSLFTSHTTAHLLSSLLPSKRITHKITSAGTATSKTYFNEDGDSDTDWANGAKAYYNNKPHSISVTRLGGGKVDRAGPVHTGPFRSLLSILGFGTGQGQIPKAGSRRIPGSGNLDWTDASDWVDDQKPIKTKSVAPTSTSSKTSDVFVIGKEDWRDPDYLTSTKTNDALAAASKSIQMHMQTSGILLPGSGEYSPPDEKKPRRSWWSRRPVSSVGADMDSVFSFSREDMEHDAPSSHTDVSHEGLWVTLTPTNVSTSPFFDTLLVLVVSPLVTLTVVYALLLLRSRIRRRRWRAPKSVVDRLPVRTYYTISEPSSSPTPGASSPTTPLLQRFPEQSRSPTSSSRSDHSSDHHSSEIPGASSAVQPALHDRTEEKPESGLAAWRRRYGGRQRECVVCLDEYEDGVSQVMSLPCGHEFHADCITPWLVTRRRTCPICKGDVVRSLSQSYHDHLEPSSPLPSPPHFDSDLDDVQTQAARTRNDSPSASRPVPILASESDDAALPHDDVEHGWTTGDTRDESHDVSGSMGAELSSSLRDLSSTISTVIWRGFDAVRATTGLQRRSPPGDVDRDR